MDDVDWGAGGRLTESWKGRWVAQYFEDIFCEERLAVRANTFLFGLLLGLDVDNLNFLMLARWIVRDSGKTNSPVQKSPAITAEVCNSHRPEAQS